MSIFVKKTKESYDITPLRLVHLTISFFNSTLVKALYVIPSLTLIISFQFSPQTLLVLQFDLQTTLKPYKPQYKDLF